MNKACMRCGGKDKVHGYRLSNGWAYWLCDFCVVYFGWVSDLLLGASRLEEEQP